MKVILSRKGFDSKYGGMASPIMPDGTLLSMPIPGKGNRTYGELSYKDKSYEDKSYEQIIKELKPNFSEERCHLDPDIRDGVVNVPDDWKAAFGQSEAQCAHLRNQGVDVGDLFLFFGWFRQTELKNDKLCFMPKSKAPDLHIIYGYLQVGIKAEKEEIKKYPWHPHSCPEYDNNDNTLFVAADKLSWDKTQNGYGVFPYDKRLVLTKDGMTRTCWNLPDFFKKVKMSGQYEEPWRIHPQHGEYFKSMDIGQEFVIQENDDVTKWAKGLLKTP